MILYFSATGNTKYAAQKLASLLEDEPLDLLERIKKHDHSAIGSSKPFVICAPVYVCEMPRFLASFLAQTPLTGTSEVYFVFTSGGYTGIGGVAAGRHRRIRGHGAHRRALRPAQRGRDPVSSAQRKPVSDLL